MFRGLGLSRDPFADVWDGSLYWESPARRQLREDLAESLSSGQSVWLRAPPGAGRRTLLLRTAEDLSDRELPVGVLPEPPPATAEAFLERLSHLISGDPASFRLLDLAASAYRRLAEVFSESSPSTLIIPWEPDEAVEQEIGILAELRLLGVPLVAVGSLGRGAPRSESFRHVELAAPTREELQQCLSQRCAACGREGLFSADILERIAGRAEGFAHAMHLGRAELARQAFQEGAVPSLRPAAPSTEPRSPSVLDPVQLEEVDRLLDSLRPDSSVAQEDF